MTHTMHITDATLMAKLYESRIAQRQKHELSDLIPDMDDHDRMELMVLINRANHEKQKKSVLGKMILTFIALILVAGGILYAIINYL